MTEQELILHIQALKHIKPNQVWVSLVKNQIFTAPEVAPAPAYSAMFSRMFTLFSGRALITSFAVIAVLLAGSIGVMRFGLLKGTNSQVSVASPAALLEAKNNVEAFKEKSKQLAIAAKGDPKGVLLAVDEVKAAAQQLTETIKKEPEVAKAIALEINNNKTYLDVEGAGDLEATSLNELYRTTTLQLIEDYKKMSLSEDKQKSLQRIEDLINQEGFTEFDSALEDALLLGASLGDN